MCYMSPSRSWSLAARAGAYSDGRREASKAMIPTQYKGTDLKAGRVRTGMKVRAHPL